MDNKTQLEIIFREVFSAPDLHIHEAMTASEVNQWDSISHLVMISKVEEVFGIKFKLKDLIKLKNVGDLLLLIEEKRKG